MGGYSLLFYDTCIWLPYVPYQLETLTNWWRSLLWNIQKRGDQLDSSVSGILVNSLEIYFSNRSFYSVLSIAGIIFSEIKEWLYFIMNKNRFTISIASGIAVVLLLIGGTGTTTILLNTAHAQR